MNRVAATGEVVGYYARSELGKRSEQFRCKISDADYKKAVARAKQRGHSNQTRGQALFDLLQTACGAQPTVTQHATKKSPAQLDREIAEVLAGGGSTGAFEQAKAEAARLDAEAEAAGQELRAFPRGPTGLTPDAVRATPEYRAANARYQKAFARLRDFNAGYVKKFAKELREERAGRDRQRQGRAPQSHATKPGSGRWDDSPEAWQTGYDFAKESGLHETRAEQREILRRVAPGVSKYDKGFVAAYQDMLGIPRAKTKDAHATKKRGSRSSHATASDSSPRILKVSPGKTFAGQRSITAEVQYPGEKPSRVEFVGPSASIGGPGPVVMISRGHQTFVTDPSRFGNFGPDWVRRFFKDA